MQCSGEVHVCDFEQENSEGFSCPLCEEAFLQCKKLEAGGVQVSEMLPAKSSPKSER